jgi:peptidoglycan/LPS O-acetylase OafA/YrhL
VADSRRRIRSLDGLRGLAALVVVFHHSLLTPPSFASAYGGPQTRGLSGWAWIVTYTPLHLVWAGTEAVYVFFVLSGFVLTLAVGAVGFSWRSYYPSRLLRLYLPVCAAVGLTLLVVTAVPRRIIPGTSWWLNAHHEPLTVAEVFVNASLIHRTTYLDSPLWSLKWEVYFSLLLPLYIVAAKKANPYLGMALMFCAIAVGGWTGNQKIMFLPMFALGVLMAIHGDRLMRSIGSREALALTGAAVLAITARWSLHFVLSGRTASAMVGVEALEAVLVVFLFARWSTARRGGESAPVQWLGKRSFSLYLVHEPIVVSVALLLGGRANPLVTLAVALPVALLAADAFFRCIERPSHRLAQRVGRSRHFTSRAARPALSD